MYQQYIKHMQLDYLSNNHQHNWQPKMHSHIIRHFKSKIYMKKNQKRILVINKLQHMHFYHLNNLSILHLMDKIQMNKLQHLQLIDMFSNQIQYMMHIFHHYPSNNLINNWLLMLLIGKYQHQLHKKYILLVDQHHLYILDYML